jgi:hypothetical protein
MCQVPYSCSVLSFGTPGVGVLLCALFGRELKTVAHRDVWAIFELLLGCVCYTNRLVDMIGD